jgi:S-adenosylmethionine:tRNA ribosyltransferase-isomerase
MASGTPVDDYDFKIDPESIAQRPRPFAEQKLLVYRRSDQSISHQLFSDMPALLGPGDVLVLNDTRVVPAQVRVVAGNPALEGLSVLFLNPTADPAAEQSVILSQNLPVGTVVPLPGDATLTVLKANGGDPPVHTAKLALPEGKNLSLESWLDAQGEMPLPPYVTREPDERDKVEYQTSVACHPGAVAAPTAGLHFHGELLAELKARGVEVVTITLHVGYGTFRSFGAATIEEHKMDSETFEVSVASAQALWRAKQEKRRVIAVGTTSTRTLESCASELTAPEMPTEALKGAATLFIYPPFKCQVVDSLVTNFHYPKTR